MHKWDILANKRGRRQKIGKTKNWPKINILAHILGTFRGAWSPRATPGSGQKLCMAFAPKTPKMAISKITNKSFISGQIKGKYITRPKTKMTTQKAK